MFGAMYGDIVGSTYERENCKQKDFELFRAGSRYTDDTAMTLAIALALTPPDGTMRIGEFKEYAVAAMRLVGRVHPDAGYGRNFYEWIFSPRPAPYYSYGNGSAMRVSPVAWYADTLEETLAFARASAEVTHDHPEGIKGAEAIAGAVFLARSGATKEEIRAFASQYYDLDFTLDEIRPTYRFHVSCMQSVPQAIVAFLESEGFEDAIRNAISIGGDSDTIGAMTGAIAEAFYGMTEEDRSRVLSYLDDDLLEIVELFEGRFRKRD